MGSGLGRILGSAASHRITWADWIGWAELVFAAAILLFTARIWLMLLGGYMLFGVFNGLVVFATGSFASHGFSTRMEPLAVAFYCFATLALMFRFAKSPPTVLDRVALTVYLFCLWPAASGSAFSWWQVVGLATLAVSWCVFLWRASRGRQRYAHG
jgi:hypothetical protein